MRQLPGDFGASYFVEGDVGKKAHPVGRMVPVSSRIITLKG